MFHYYQQCLNKLEAVKSEIETCKKNIHLVMSEKREFSRNSPQACYKALEHIYDVLNKRVNIVTGEVKNESIEAGNILSKQMMQYGEFSDNIKKLLNTWISSGNGIIHLKENLEAFRKKNS